MRSYPEKKHGYSAVAILTLAQVFAFIDRQIPSMLVEPIKQDFNLTDSQIALLGGAAFSIFYAVMALPIGYAVDRYQRTKVLGIGIFLWSLMTALAGLANSFGKLFGARIGVAVGEAVMAPTSVSLVSDSFPENKQGKPMGIITSGVYIGIGITLLGGGFLIDYLTEIGGINLPLIGYLKPWQATFMIVGIPGLVLAFAALYLKEPKRIEEQAGIDKTGNKKNVFLHLKEHKRTLIPMFGGLIFMALIFYSFSFWAPTMMIRAFDISLSEVGFILGIITILSSITGTILAGSAVDYLRNKNYSDAPVRAAMIAVILALPPIIGLSFIHSELGAWICIALYLLFISSFAPLGLLAISGVSTGDVKGQAAAVHAFLMMAFGLSLGPQLTAFFTDYIFVDPKLLINSISLTGLIVLPISALLFKISLSRYRESSKNLLI
ncbi:MAG TPA: MFS transporter [SAR86 cluster bacterium]|jgi:MFS family permease|nr:MFS transporter [SAR86 cluster bacterium]